MMIMTRHFSVLTLFAVATLSKCSIVIDRFYDSYKIVDKYCPKMEFCEEGSHVMCMYYTPTRVMGPQCHESKDLHISADEASKFLEVSNLIRGYVAKGEETGKDGVKLPKAYGMYRLEWDEELATFAQVLANQCVLKHDLCRSSKKFPDPGQTAGIVRFSFPDWNSINGFQKFPPGLSSEKLMYSVYHIMQTWYSLKSYVSLEMLEKYPNWIDHPDKAARLYLEMINGKSTHMGCGISAYAEYAYHANNADLTYNNVQVICNFSTRTREKEKVYNTDAPTNANIGYTIKCGCPVGYDEDRDCLCYRSGRQLPQSCSNDQCKPNVVLLPIFTVENAPESKMIHAKAPPKSKLSKNLTDSFEILDKYERFTKTSHFVSPTQPRKKITPKPQKRFNANKPLNVGRRYFDRGTTTKRPIQFTPLSRRISSSIQQKPKPKIEQSVFTRYAVFQLPDKKLQTPAKTQRPLVRKDVAPRKDFSTVKKLATTYLTRRRLNSKDTDPKLNEELQNVFNNSANTEATTEKQTTTTIHVMHSNHYPKDNTYDYSNVSKHTMFHPGATDGDSNVLSLLNELKSEVKHVDFDEKEKDLFDTKLREIYDSLTANHFDDYFNNDMKDNDSLKIDHRELFDSFAGNKLGQMKSMHHDYDGLFRRKYQKDKSNIDMSLENKHDDDTIKENKIREIYGVRRRNKDFYRRKGNGDMLRGNYYLNKDNGHGLSSDRRRYYQEKLDNLERKLFTMRGYKRKNAVPDDRHIRPMKPPNRINRRRFDNNMFYMPDRARFIHGFK